MATLKFCDTHNMIAYLNKTKGSEGFHQIVDFLNYSPIKFALTENPTIYTSLIQQFWQTVIANTHDTREIQIIATIHGNVKLISEASIRRHLKLEDSDGISTPPHTEIFTQLALMGYASNSDKLTFQKGHFSPQWVPTPPHDSPLPGGHTSGSDQGSLTLNELIRRLLEQAKLEAKIVISDDDMVLEDSSKQGRMIEDIDQDAGVILVTPTKVSSQEDQPKDHCEVSTASRIISIAKETVSTAGVSLPVSTVGMVQESTSSPRAIKDKAKRQRMAQVHQAAQNFTEDEWENIRARVEVDEELTQKLQAEEREKYSEDDRTTMFVDLINQRKKFFAQQRAKAKRNKPMTQAQQRTYMSNYIKHMGSYTLKQLKKLSFKEIKELFKATIRRIQDFVLIEREGNNEVFKFAGVGGLKRDAEGELDQGISKKQKTNEASGSV
nr:hypothetical protein [Tanacetum cinerariifolium]